jgi:L-fucose isomerase-like protein
LAHFAAPIKPAGEISPSKCGDLRCKVNKLQMVDPTRIAVLPIGELDTDLIRIEVDAMIAAIRSWAGELLIAPPAPDETQARQAMLELSESAPDLFLIIPLRGLSAQAIETAIRSSHAPCLIWPVQGRFALPSSALAVGAVQEAGMSVELLYGPPDHPLTGERIRHFTRAARAVSRIRKGRLGVIGGLFPNLVSCRYDPATLSARLGITLVPIPFEEVRRSIQTAGDSRSSPPEMAQFNLADPAAGSAMAAGLRLHQVLRRMAQERSLAGFVTECWSGFPRELGMNPCLGFIEDAYTLACEGDAMLCVGLLMARTITGVSAYAGDLYDVDLEGQVTLVHCGGPASLASSPGKVVLARSQLAQDRGFETVTCRPALDPGPVTLFRFYGRGCDQMHVAAGELSECDTSQNLTVHVRLAGDRWGFLEQCFGNHYVMAAGDIRGELKLLGKWLGIEIVET